MKLAEYHARIAEGERLPIGDRRVTCPVCCSLQPLAFFGAYDCAEGAACDGCCDARKERVLQMHRDLATVGHALGLGLITHAEAEELRSEIRERAA